MMKTFLNRLLRSGNSEQETGQKTGQDAETGQDTVLLLEDLLETSSVDNAKKHLGLSDADLKKAIQENVDYINDFRTTLLEFCNRLYDSVVDEDTSIVLIGLSRFRDELIIPDEESRRLMLNEIANVVIPNLNNFCDDEYGLEIEIARTNRLTEIISVMPLGLQFIDPSTTNTYPNRRGIQTYDASKNIVVNTGRYNKIKAFYDKHAARIFAEENKLGKRISKAAYTKKSITDQSNNEVVSNWFVHLFEHHGMEDVSVKTTMKRNCDDFLNGADFFIEASRDGGLHGCFSVQTHFNRIMIRDHQGAGRMLVDCFYDLATKLDASNPPSARLLAYALSVFQSGKYDSRIGIYK